MQDTLCSHSLLTIPQKKRRNDNQNRSLAYKIFHSQYEVQKSGEDTNLLDLA